ncbi:MAG: NADH-quinone oxidoreductase subunit M [Candidatus Heimdallarchaeota archaeon]|nr:NADH-quinone oxidoreductase subunit M [Candidatus Heimdallarchaeota archaeon]MDH5646776.1 NADH-quinone oxidoreductase subunit M [Candidatus Heimdallarchaeota archaeon]
MELLYLLLIPISLALPTYLVGRWKPEFAKYLATLTILVTTIYNFILWFADFTNPSTNYGSFMYNYTKSWVPSVGIYFSVGVDGLSMPLLVLTQLVFLVSVVSSYYIKDQQGTYYALLLVLLTGVTGTFIALDLFLFYIFWELVLVPMFFMIHIWGGPNRKYAAIKFFIFTHLASLVMLIGLFYIYLEAYRNSGQMSFLLVDLKVNLNGVSFKTLALIFWLVFIGFVTKFPQVPVHTWLPDAHVQAPSPGSAILAGLLLKMGGYGLIRIPFWLFADVVDESGQHFFDSKEGHTIRIIIGFIGMVSMVYPAFIALQQDDLKRMIAYSSISHMGVVLLGLAAYNEWGINGAMYMMIAHGVISPGLFLLSGIIEHNTKSHTRDMSKVGGLAHKMPFTAALFVFMAFASAGLPGLAGFVSEFNVFIGLFANKELMASNDKFFIFPFLPYVIIPVLAVLSIIVTAGYYLWAIQKVIFLEQTDELENSTPAKWWEIQPVFILAIFTVILGLFPNTVWMVLDSWTQTILPH